MMATIENPQITLEDLNKIEMLVRENKAKSEDYEVLDNYLGFLGASDFLLNKLREYRINNFETFIYERKTNPRSEINLLVGGVLGTISFLKKYISGK